MATDVTERYKITWQYWNELEQGWEFAACYEDHSYEARERVAIKLSECGDKVRNFRIFDKLRGQVVPQLEGK